MENQRIPRTDLPARAEELVAAWRGAPDVDLVALRHDIDEVLDPLFEVGG